MSLGGDGKAFIARAPLAEQERTKGFRERQGEGREMLEERWGRRERQEDLEKKEETSPSLNSGSFHEQFQ